MSQSENTAVAVQGTETQTSGLVLVDFSKGNLPDLSKADAFPFDLSSEYWSPSEQGESRRVYFDRIENQKVLDQKTGEIIDLECALFVEVVSGEAKSISNGSKRLVGALQAHGIQRGTPLLITFLGKKKNKSNTNFSDSWSVKLLKISL